MAWAKYTIVFEGKKKKGALHTAQAWLDIPMGDEMVRREGAKVAGGRASRGSLVAMVEKGR